MTVTANLLFSRQIENKIKRLLVALFFYFAPFYGGSLNAAIIDHGTYLTDTETGLDWLDLTLTVNKPRFLVERDLWVGGIYEGWRFASGVEFNKLVFDYTQTSVNSYEIVYHTEGSIDGLVQLLGSTLDSGYNLIRGNTYDAELGVAEGEGVDYTYGFLADKALLDYYYVAILADVDGRWIWGGQLAQSEADYSRAHDALYSRTAGSAYFGSYLVRETTVIPEPDVILLLFVSSLAFFASRAIQKKYNQ